MGGLLPNDDVKEIALRSLVSLQGVLTKRSYLLDRGRHLQSWIVPVLLLFVLDGQETRNFFFHELQSLLLNG